MNLRNKAVSGFIWSFVEGFTSKSITFIIGLVLARMLSPKEFGLIGMLTIFISISSVFIHSGFSQALIRKKSCSEIDFSTVFYFNLAISMVLYAILFFTADLISQFYDQPILIDLIRVLGIILIINALTIIQNTKLTKDINFKLLTRISIISATTSGGIAIAMAATGFGVWSLVAQRVLSQFFKGALLWIWNNWKPKRAFSIDSFKNLWGFGGRIMIFGLFNVVFREIHQMVIGKFYPAAQLGQYNRADTFKKFPESNFRHIIERVTLPLMAPLQDNLEELRNGYKKILNATFLLTSFTMLVISAISIELVEFILGSKWHLAGEYLQILCFSTIFFPLNFINQSILKTKNKAKHLLNLGVMIKLLNVFLILIVIFINIKTMLYAMIVYEFIGYIIMAHFAGRLINYGPLKQMKDLLPTLLIVGGIFLELFFINQLLDIAAYLKIVILLSIAMVSVVVLLETFKIKSYLFLKEVVIEKIKDFRKK